MQDQLQRSFLEVDEEEWQRHTCGPDTSAAANGFRMVVRPMQQDACVAPQVAVL